MQEVYNLVAQELLKLKKCVVLTGAGISAESGIPTFRSKGGMWEKYDPAVYASIEVFRRDPSKYWTIRGDFIRNYDLYSPNAGHYALVELEEMGILNFLVTQNIDGLHTKAGSKNVLEIHGSLRETYCLRCGKEYIAPHVPEGNPPYCACGGVLKPNTVLFGEQLPQDALMKAHSEATRCRVMLVIGTSAVVQPAASLPFSARECGATVIEINIERALPAAHYFIQGKAGVVLPRIVREIEKRG